jgi:hypothetical protein
MIPGVIGHYHRPASSRYQISGVGDFNKDGTDDVVWYNPSNTTSTCSWSLADS